MNSTVIFVALAFLILFWLMLWYIGDLRIRLNCEQKLRKINEEAYNELYKDTVKWLEQNR